MQEMVKKAVKAAAEFNSHFNRERRDERKAYLDMQTNVNYQQIYFFLCVDRMPL